MEFSPIAIVGQGCALPGALSPPELWSLVVHRQNALTAPPPGYWGDATPRALTEPPDPTLDRILSNRGGYLRGFEERFDLQGFQIPAAEIIPLDRLVHWILYTGREALTSAGHDVRATSARVGAIFGNLSYPTRAMVDFAEWIWWGRQGKDGSPDPRNRFTSGFPAHLLARALGLGAGAFTLDAACASSLYAIKLACDWLHDGRADLMLAGGVNAADGFIIHGGFTVLQAISPTGRSRPFHRQADGLVPAEGAAFVVLKRLDDAEAVGDRILGVIRGIGLTNDGRGQGFLVPSEAAQALAMRQAYAVAGLRPSEISLMECHATGTLVGDAAEIRSMSEVFKGSEDLPVGSLKSNLGHLITASGAAAVLKVLAAMDAGVLPPTLHADEPTEALAGTPFRLVREAEPWRCEGPRRAGINGFGFGGNNAHLIVEQWSSGSRTTKAAARRPATADVAIVGVGVRLAECRGPSTLVESLLSGRTQLTPRPGRPPAASAETIELDLFRLRFPPDDLKHALPQQLLVLEAALQIAEQLEALPALRTGVFVGMQCDAEAARIAARCRLPERIRRWRDADPDRLAGGRLASGCAGIGPPLTPAGVIGAMPNIVANRLNSCFDLKGPGFSVSAEELSGIVALELGVRALRRGELDAAVIGAVDLSCEPVHEAATDALFPAPRKSPADAAVILLLKRLDDARRDGDTIYAALPEHPPARAGLTLSLDDEATDLQPMFGHAHAACGLLYVAAAALACYHRALPARAGTRAMPWLPEHGGRTARVSIDAFGGQARQVWLKAPATGRPGPAFPAPRLRVYSAESRDGLLRALQRDDEDDRGFLRLVIVSRDDETFAAQRERAATVLNAYREAPRPLRELAEGIYLGESPVPGDLAFVFTGPAGAHPQMGRDLLLALPELVDGLSEGFQHMRQAAGWIFDPGAGPESPPADKLWAASFLCQVHAELTRGLLGLSPRAAIGFCSGESNALFALGAWTDMDRMYEEIEALGVFSHQLGGDFEAARRAWKLHANATIDWESWRILAPVADVRRALASELKAHLIIVSAPTDVVISGDGVACRRVVGRIGSTAAQPLGYNVVMHCPEAETFAEAWRELHHRPTAPVPGVRFYTHATCSAYQPTADRVADVLTRQAMRQVDFPSLIEQAWTDGVRIFLEHGPLSGCTRWIDQILGTREHVALALDRPATSSLLQAVDTTARLAAIGVPVNHRALAERLGGGAPAAADTTATGRSRRTVFAFAPHWKSVEVPEPQEADAIPARDEDRSEAPTWQTMALAPWLPPVSDEAIGREESRDGTEASPLPERSADPALHPIAAYHARVAAAHNEFLRQQSEVHQRFLTLMRNAGPDFVRAPREVHPTATSRYSVGPPRGPRFSREQLKVHASGEISSLFGPPFERQDGYRLQVRLPEEPLLLVDRVTGIDGEAGSMKQGTIWTESDVTWESWYLHHGRMPAGLMVEAGQADLMLISWLGVDFLNQGRRTYRLLGCEGAYHGGLPKPGDTLCYDIHIDRYARQGDVLLFFFHYDCRIDGEVRLSVRNGQAGFFTAEEIATSQGVVWDPSAARIKADARLDPPAVPTTRHRFTAAQVRAFAEGRILEAFGPGFERAEAHTRTPRIMSGPLHLLGEVEALEPAGGPWGRGYLRAVTRISPDDWFFRGHFKNDPCMPGTLMFQAGLEAMAFYLAAMGYTLERDGWRFEPVTNETYTLRCRGQVVPTSQKLVYEIFVQEILAGPRPTLYADMLCAVDGLKAFHGQRIGLRLVPDWPLEGDRQLVELLSRHVEPKPIARFDGFDYGFPSLLASAWGRPSRAFGPMYRDFDGPRRVARLPGPPYHFMSRLCRIEASQGGMQEGSVIDAEYDVPADAWYFEQTRSGTMPLCVLLESALQPCGWLASFAGCTLTTEQDLFFRNLDGTATVYGEVFPDAGTLRTRTRLTSISKVGSIMVLAFDVEIAAAEARVCDVRTTFGFFTAETLANQTGLPPAAPQSGPDDAAGEVVVDLTARPARYFDGALGLSEPMLLMIDRVTGYWPQGGKAHLGRARAEKRIDPSAWFFKAHFFQDPVQPGTLGLEAMLQVLQFVMLQLDLGRDIADPRFEPVAIGHTLSWKYRGQIRPENRTVVVDLELVKIDADDQGVLAVAEASLWVDDLRIYHASGLGMRIVSALRRPPAEAETRDEAPASAPAPASPPLDLRPVRAHWREALGLDHGSFSEDLYMALIEKYVRRVVVDDPEALAETSGRSALFLGNHQVAIETPLLMILASYLSGVSVSVVAKAQHQQSWMGDLFSRTFSYPGIRTLDSIIYFDRDDQKSALQSIERVKRDLLEHNRSLMVHVEGTRSRTCREPVKRLSALFLDIAVEIGLPIVPVRFVGGLSVEESPQRLEFPVGHGSQDYYVGSPIFPERLRHAPYLERKHIIIDAINALGPSNAQEEPHPGDPQFAADVEAWHLKTDAAKEHAALFTALRRLSAPHDQTVALMEGAQRGSLVVRDDGYGRWFGDFARLLYGPRGPSVINVADAG